MLRRARKIPLAVLLATCVAALAAAPAGAASVYWGANIGSHLTGASPPYDMSAADKFEGMTSKRMSLIEYSLPWAQCAQTPCTFTRFPAAQMEAIRRRGALPVFGWASYSQPLDENQPDFKLSKITGGAYDDYIRSWAADARAYGHPFFLNFDWEMNLGGLWPYVENKNGNQRGDFVKMWRHVHDIFRQEGATNATWVWCPNIEYPGSADLKGLYPGDAYVDWTCIDGYNWFYGWVDFADMLGPTYDAVQQIAPSKPLLIGETASTEKGGSKADWITDMLSIQIPHRFPNVKGLVWFEQLDPVYAQQDPLGWPIESSPSAQAAFAAGIASPYYAPGPLGDIPSPIPPLSPVIPKGSATLSAAGTLQDQPGVPPALCRRVVGKVTCSARCVSRISKTSGRPVLVCKRESVILKLKVADRIRRGLAAPRVVAARGGAIRFRLTKDATVTMRLERRSRGRFRRLPGSRSFRLRRGARGISFAGRLSRRASARLGTHRVSLTARDSSGYSSRTVRATFKVAAGR